MAISKKLKEEVKSKVSIVDLASDYFDLIDHGRYYSFRNQGKEGDYSSIVIYPDTNSYFRNSNRKGGDIISFVLETEIEGIQDFQEAVEFLKKRIDPTFSIQKTSRKKAKPYLDMTTQERVEFIKKCHNDLSEGFKPDDNNRNAIAYLLKERNLDKEIVYREINKKRIQQCITPNGSKGIAFIGYNYGLLSAVSIRGINNNSTFKGDLRSCNYNIGWVLYPESRRIEPHSKVFCFEGYIDMLSYQTLLKQKQIDFKDDIFICCGSVNKYFCVTNMLQEMGLNNDVVICFDNDKVGIEMGDTLREKIEELNLGNKITKELSVYKDWNEDLKKLYPSTGIKDRKINAYKKSNDFQKKHFNNPIKIKTDRNIG